MPAKGQKHSNHWSKDPVKKKEVLEKISKKLKGRPPNSGSFKKGKKNAWEGQKLPKEWAENAAKGREGKCGGWNKGLPGLRGEDNGKWKGEEVGMVSLHKWVYRWKGCQKKCEECGLDDPNRMYHWANISGEYKRDLDDFKRLCVPCHKRFDLDRLNK